MLAVIYSDEFLEHKTGRFHPEKPERLGAIVAALQDTSFAHQLEWRSPTTDSQRAIAWLEKVHSPHHVQSVRELATQGGGYLDLDTPVSPRSYDVALLAVNAWLDGIDYTLAATNNPAFVLSRPPGHHAESDRGMGFCLFSNAAIAAHYALEQPNINRVAILDWDVHHGNGTQAIVENHPQIAFCSLHQSPCYPGTGTTAETGAYNNVLNLPLAPGGTITDYQPVFETQVMPFLTKFQPDLLIVSAGYDANAADPLAEMYLQPQDYGLFTEFCLKITHRIVFGLEGGYDLSALAQSVVATIERCIF